MKSGSPSKFPKPRIALSHMSSQPRGHAWLSSRKYGVPETTVSSILYELSSHTEGLVYEKQSAEED